MSVRRSCGSFATCSLLRLADTVAYKVWFWKPTRLCWCVYLVFRIFVLSFFVECVDNYPGWWIFEELWIIRKFSKGRRKETDFYSELELPSAFTLDNETADITHPKPCTNRAHHTPSYHTLQLPHPLAEGPSSPPAEGITGRCAEDRVTPGLVGPSCWKRQEDFAALHCKEASCKRIRRVMDWSRGDQICWVISHADRGPSLLSRRPEPLLSCHTSKKFRISVLVGMTYEHSCQSWIFIVFLKDMYSVCSQLYIYIDIYTQGTCECVCVYECVCVSLHYVYICCTYYL